MTLPAVLPYILPILALSLTAAAAGVFARSAGMSRTVDTLQRMIGSYEAALDLAERKQAEAERDLAAARTAQQDQAKRLMLLEVSAGTWSIDRAELMRQLAALEEENRRLRAAGTH